MKTGIHYARLKHSARLQRVMQLLADGQPHTTMEIIQAAQVCAVSSIVSELRRNGITIACRPVPGTKGCYEYQLGVGC